MIFRKPVAALVCASVTSLSFACKPGDLEHEIEMHPQSAALENGQIQALASWYALWQKRKGGVTQGIGEIGVFANAIKGSAASNALARQRIDNVIRLIKTGDDSPAQLHWAIFPLKTKSPLATATIDQVMVVVQPACAKTQSCCPTAQ
ncbi:hypothetical protein [Variovorax sp. GT1P44]|uniref:hypothetical protein n=1 Tax=Variovorax sp. GT1P44 TaxID=3443742 RepID=UPI003F44D6D8